MEMSNPNRILYEDNDILVCHKPAGIATQTARVGQADMVSEITNYLVRTANCDAESKDGHKPPGSPYVGIVHRLDQPVEGILVFAVNRHAAAELSRQIRENRMEKYYYAIVCGREFSADGKLTDYLLKDGKTNTSRIVPKEIKDARKAELDYRVVSEAVCGEETESCLRIALVEIRLHTGRHHQIRVQMSNAGMSLLGDHKYADAETIKVSEYIHVKDIALCAYKLIFFHPVTGARLQFEIKPEGKSFQSEYWQNYADHRLHNEM